MSETSAHTNSFDVYLHVPFYATRCGYRDFSTYMPGQLGSGATREDYLDAIVAELGMAVVEHPELACGADTIFVSDGTPSTLGASSLRRLLDGVRNSFGLADDTEVATRSNPESTSPELFEDPAETGFTRVSLNMRLAVPHVLTTLDRTHTPGRPAATVAKTHTAGFEHINFDVIYGTSRESIADLDTTLEAVLATGVDHVSAYSPIVEPGIAMTRKIHHDELPMPDDNGLTDHYGHIDAALSQTGSSQYEVSNWVRPGSQYRHNMIYWYDGNWWGAGPGAHSYLDDTRFYSAKRPTRYAATISDGELPIKDSEELTAEDRRTEKIMLGPRLAGNIDANLFDEDKPGKARR